jgi:monofunctional biosynthetic peptidoglycan transglycosylase
MKEAAVSRSTEEAKQRSKGKGKSRSPVRRFLRGLLIIIVVLILLPLVLVPLYSVVNPPVTTVMLLKALGGAGIEKSWADIDDISPRLVRSVVMSEDVRFCEHHGIDWVEVKAALDSDSGRLRGASTITMQTVKNLFLWTSRSYVRKALEVPLALYADFVLSKRRIMEIYLNVAEWGEGIYGAEAAARHYFDVPASELGTVASARLAAVLPAPTSRNAANPGPTTERIAENIRLRAMLGRTYVACIIDEP